MADRCMEFVAAHPDVRVFFESEPRADRVVAELVLGRGGLLECFLHGRDDDAKVGVRFQEAQRDEALGQQVEVVVLQPERRGDEPIPARTRSDNEPPPRAPCTE